MEIYEINAAMKYSYYKHKDSWEQTRLIAFLIAQTNSKKHLELSDIIKFKWDEEIIEDNIITEKQREELIKKANQYIINSHPLKTIFQHKACTDKLYADSFYKVQKNSHSSFEVICCRR